LQAAIFFSTPIWHLWTEILSLGGWAILTFFVAAQLFRWEPESKIPRKAKLWAAATALPFLLLGIWENHSGTILLQSKAALHAINNPTKPEPQTDTPSPSNEK
jgi:hypothetical protein